MKKKITYIATASKFDYLSTDENEIRLEVDDFFKTKLGLDTSIPEVADFISSHSIISHMSQMRYYNGVKYSVSSFFKEFLDSDTMINELIGLIEEYGNTNSSWYKKLISLGPHEYIDDKTAKDLMVEVTSDLLEYEFSKKSEIPLALDEIMANLQHRYNIRKYKVSKLSYEGTFIINIYFNGDTAQYQLCIDCWNDKDPKEVYNDRIRFNGYGDVDHKYYESLDGIGWILRI